MQNMEKYFGFKVKVSRSLDPEDARLLRDEAKIISTKDGFDLDDYYVYLHQLVILGKEEHFGFKGKLDKRVSRIDLIFSINHKQRESKKIRFFNHVIKTGIASKVKPYYTPEEIGYRIKSSYFEKSLCFQNAIVTFIHKDIKKDHKKIKLTVSAMPTDDFRPYIDNIAKTASITQLDIRFEKHIQLNLPDFRNALSDDDTKSVENNITFKNQMNVEEKINTLISAYHGTKPHKQFDNSYQAIFADEGERKAEYIVKDIKNKEQNGLLNSAKLGYLSIGGADGSEVLSVLGNTSISHAAIIEISDSGSDTARKIAARVKKKGKSLKVFQGDATQRLDDALSYLAARKNDGDIDGIVLSTQAVLHELPRRSPNFDMLIFLGKIFKGFNDCLLYAREPISPTSWPDEIRLKIGNASGDSLKKFAIFIRNYLQIKNDPVHALAGDYVLMKRELAVEVLHKLLRSTSTTEFEFEMGEQLTSLDANMFQRLVESILGQGSCTLEPLITQGFEDAYLKYDVMAMNREGNFLSLPHTHARFLAFNNKKSRKDRVRNNESVF